MEKFYVMNDFTAKAREAFVIAENKVDELDYYGYYTVDTFDSKEKADKFCEDFNAYIDEPDVEFNCCSKGCTMTAYENAHRGDGCVYEGM